MPRINILLIGPRNAGKTSIVADVGALFCNGGNSVCSRGLIGTTVGPVTKSLKMHDFEGPGFNKSMNFCIWDTPGFVSLSDLAWEDLMAGRTLRISGIDVNYPDLCTAINGHAANVPGKEPENIPLEEVPHCVALVVPLHDLSDDDQMSRVVRMRDWLQQSGELLSLRLVWS